MLATQGSLGVTVYPPTEEIINGIGVRGPREGTGWCTTGSTCEFTYIHTSTLLFFGSLTTRRCTVLSERCRPPCKRPSDRTRLFKKSITRPLDARGVRDV